MVSPDGFPSSRPGGHYQGGSPVHRRPGTSLSRKSGAAAAPTSPAPTVRQYRRQAARPAQGAHSVKQRHRASKHSETSTRPPRSGRSQITETLPEVSASHQRSPTSAGRGLNLYRLQSDAAGQRLTGPRSLNQRVPGSKHPQRSNHHCTSATHPYDIAWPTKAPADRKPANG